MQRQVAQEGIWVSLLSKRSMKPPPAMLLLAISWLAWWPETALQLTQGADWLELTDERRGEHRLLVESCRRCGDRLMVSRDGWVETTLEWVERLGLEVSTLSASQALRKDFGHERPGD